MQLTDQDYILLEDYLDNVLESEAKTALESKIRNDSEFRKEAFQYLLTLKALREKQQDALQEKMKKLDNQTVSVIPIWRWVAYAGGLGVAAALVFFMFRSPLHQYEALADKYFEPIDIIRTRDASENLTLEANQAYLDKKYSVSAAKYEAAFKTNQSDSSLLLFAGISYYGNKTLDKSVICLIPLANSNGNDSESALWYLALTYLRQGDTDESSKILDKLIISNTTFKQKATSLKEEIQKLKK
jgi:hypothetical protein